LGSLPAAERAAKRSAAVLARSDQPPPSLDQAEPVFGLEIGATRTAVGARHVSEHLLDV
jgi:hypothetical protein